MSTGTRSKGTSKIEDSVTVSLSNDEIEDIVKRAVAAAVKEVQELVNVKLEELQKKVQEQGERLSRLEQSIDDKYLTSHTEFHELAERLWKLEQTVNNKNLTSQVASDVSKSLSVELNAVRVESRESLLTSNDNEQYNRRNNLRFHGIQPDKNCRSLAVDFIKNVLKVSGVEEENIEAAHSAFPDTQRTSAETSQGKRPVILIRFRRREDRDKVIRARRILKGTKYAVTEDLTLLNVKTMNRVKNNEYVQNVWTWNGKIHALLKNGKKIIVRPFQSLDQLM